VSLPWAVEVLLEGTGYSSTCVLATNREHRVVIDTGLSLQEAALAEALRLRSLEPADIDLVINTHLHIDHCSNNAGFSRAAIFMSREEWRWTRAFYDALFVSHAPERVFAEFYPEATSHHLERRTIRRVVRLARLVWDASRLGDEERFHWIETCDLPPGLEVLPTPGHTPHHLSIRVAGPEPIIVAGDAVLDEQGDANARVMPPYSRAQFMATREALLERGERIVPGHGAAFVPKPSGACSA
jgi:glyoxylase-like metal-dependent hydrolase (beta-lactamase superfamily II)